MTAHKHFQLQPGRDDEFAIGTVMKSPICAFLWFAGPEDDRSRLQSWFEEVMPASCPPGPRIRERRSDRSLAPPEVVRASPFRDSTFFIHGPGIWWRSAIRWRTIEAPSRFVHGSG